MRRALSCIVRSLAFVLFITVQRGSAQTAADSTLRASGPGSTDSSHARLIPISTMGSLDRSPALVIPDSVRNFSDYTYTGDLFSAVPGVYIFDLASPGQLNGVTMNGLDHRSIAFFSDGAPLNDPMTGAYNLYLYPAEHADRIEIISGASAFYYGLNSNGGAINFVSRSLRAVHPYTRVRYIQAPYDHTYFDGSFSQDIIRGLNLSVGVFHNTNTGRFPNSDYADWGARVKVRYDVSNRVNFFASGMYATTNLNLSGGVNLDSTGAGDPYDPVSGTLKMVNTDSYEKIHRYDTQAGAAAALWGDTTAITTATFYHSTNLREYRDEENRIPSNGRYVKEDTRSQWYGVKLNQHLEVGPALLDVGYQAESRGIIASDLFPPHVRNLTSVFGKLELRPVSFLDLTALGRYDNFLSQDVFSYGFEGTLHLSDEFKLLLGMSQSHQFPTFQELHLPDTLFDNSAGNGVQDHSLVEIGAALAMGNLRASIRYTHRIVELFHFIVPASIGSDPTFTSPAKELDVIDGSLSFRFGAFFTELSAQNFSSKRNQSEINLPKWSGVGGMYFWDKIIGGHLDLKTGIRARMFSPMNVVEYNPQAQVYFSSYDPDMPGAAVFDFVLIGHLGTAYISIIMENFLDAKYITTSFYPMNERIFRFGLSWEFLD